MTTPREQYYDANIAPKLKAIAEECEATGISLLAVCEFAPGATGRTLKLGEEVGMNFAMTVMAAECNGDLDTFMKAMTLFALRNGHTSHELEKAGVPKVPAGRMVA